MPKSNNKQNLCKSMKLTINNILLIEHKLTIKVHTVFSQIILYNLMRQKSWLMCDSNERFIKDMTCDAQKMTHSWAYYRQGDIDTFSQDDSPNGQLFTWTVTLRGESQKRSNGLKETEWWSGSHFINRIYYWTSINSSFYPHVPVQTNTDHSLGSQSRIQILHGVILPCSRSFVLPLWL